MRFAYADPPYLGCCGRYQHRHDPPYGCWDDVATHRALLVRLMTEYPDGWAVSLHTPSIVDYAAIAAELMPDRAFRWGSWEKPFAVYKPNVNPAYTWEPVLFAGGRKRGRDVPTARDSHSESITLKKGLVGAKPKRFGQWVAELLGVADDDTLDDLFPGTGSVADSLAQRRMAL